MENFLKLMYKRWKTKKKTGRKIDRNGHLVNFLLTPKEYLEIFLPYKNDERLYLPYRDKNRLCLCRNDDLGDYTINNVYVDTIINNISLGATREETLKKRSLLNKEKYPNGIWFGRKHSKETKQKMSETHSKNKHQQGEKNSCYGTCWIYNLELKENKKISKDEINKWLNNGWVKGRKVNF